MTLNAKIGGFMDLLAISAATQVYIIHNLELRNYHYVHFGTTVVKLLYFVPNSCKSNSNSDRNFRCTIDVKNVFYVFYSCHVFLRFLTFFILLNVFYFKKTCIENPIKSFVKHF